MEYIMAIAARGEQGELGNDGSLPWRWEADMHRFRRVTMGDTVVVGRKTYENLPELDGREVVVISETLDGDNVYDNINDALYAGKAGQGATWVIGGESIYEQTLSVCSHLHLTEIPGTYPEADSYFPQLNGVWEEIYSEPGPNGLEWKQLRNKEVI